MKILYGGSFSRVVGGGGSSKQPLPSRTSIHAHFWERWEVVHWWWWMQYAALENVYTLVFEGDGRWWWWMQHATLENKHMRLFLRVVDLLYKLVNNIEIVKSNQHTLYYHMQSPRGSYNPSTPSQMSIVGSCHGNSALRMLMCHGISILDVMWTCHRPKLYILLD